MRRLICCDYHDDSESVELRYTDGTLIDIDCLGVEDEFARNSDERSELACCSITTRWATPIWCLTAVFAIIWTRSPPADRRMSGNSLTFRCRTRKT